MNVVVPLPAPGQKWRVSLLMWIVFGLFAQVPLSEAASRTGVVMRSSKPLLAAGRAAVEAPPSADVFAPKSSSINATLPSVVVAENASAKAESSSALKQASPATAAAEPDALGQEHRHAYSRTRARVRQLIGKLLEKAAKDIALAKAHNALKDSAEAAIEDVKKAEKAGEEALEAAEAAELQIDDDVPNDPSFRGSAISADASKSASTASSPPRRKHMLGAIMAILPKASSLNGVHMLLVVLLVLLRCAMQPGKGKADGGVDERQHPLYYVFASRNMRGTQYSHFFL